MPNAARRHSTLIFCRERSICSFCRLFYWVLPTATPSPTSLNTAPTKFSRSSTVHSTLPCIACRTAAGSSSEWGPSENNRKARFYSLTAAGRKQLLRQTGRWEQLVAAVNRVLNPSGSRP